MRASTRWLKSLTRIDEAPEVFAERLTFAGVEVESIERPEPLHPRIVVAEVRGRNAHPDSSTLSLVTLWDGEGTRTVVCGASNIPEPGGWVALAQPGAVLPGSGTPIAEMKVAGHLSEGMLCSEHELRIGADATGLLVIDHDEKITPGQPLGEALQLGDAILHLSLTPNRADCLGHIGLARELCVLFDVPFELPSPPVEITLQNKHKDLRIDIEDPNACTRYSACVMRDAVLAPSPFWLRRLLFSLGERPINNVVDITNYILLLSGHPIHAFDMDRIHSETIRVRYATKGERIETLDGIERELQSEDLIIADSKDPIALAGIMGGEHSSVQAPSRSVLIECAHFDPSTVRRGARRHGMHTEASHRFERGVDPNDAAWVLSHTVAMMASLCHAQPDGEGVETYPGKKDLAPVTLRQQRIAHVLGLSIASDVSERILRGLGCALQTTEDGFRCTPPSYRPDLRREIDFVEEVGRVWGYDKIPTHTPSICAATSEHIHTELLQRRLRRAAATLGLNEAINYAFCSEDDLSRCKQPAIALPLLNPLSEERSVMRTSLLPGLLQNIQRAQNHQVARSAFFELARVYIPLGQGKLPSERYHLDFVLSGPKVVWIGTEQTYDFFDGKGIASNLVHTLVRSEPDFIPITDADDEHAYLHPNQSVRITVDDMDIGHLGMVHPDITDAFDLRGDVVYGSLRLDAIALWQQQHTLPQAKTLPRYPASSRDIALVLLESDSFAKVKACFQEQHEPLLESIDLFDIYRGDQIPKHHKSLALRITYRDPHQTLTDATVDAVHARLSASVTSALGCTTR